MKLKRSYSFRLFAKLIMDESIGLLLLEYVRSGGLQYTAETCSKALDQLDQLVLLGEYTTQVYNLIHHVD